MAAVFHFLCILEDDVLNLVHSAVGFPCTVVFITHMLCLLHYTHVVFITHMLYSRCSQLYQSFVSEVRTAVDEMVRDREVCLPSRDVVS